MFRVFITHASILDGSLPALLRARRVQAVVELALHQQLAIYAHEQHRRRLTAADQGFWTALLRPWPRWRSAPLIDRPETVACWHRKRRPTEHRPSAEARIIGLQRVGGPLRRSEWQEAA